MKRLVRYALTVAVAAALLGACGKDEIIPEPEVPEQTTPGQPGTEPGEGSGEGSGEETGENPGENTGENPGDQPGTGDEKVRDESDPVEQRTRVGTMPSVHITVDAKAYSSLINRNKDTYINGTIRFEDPDKWYSDTTLLESPFQMKGRGQSSWGMPKKPFRLKLDENHHSKVFGMPANRDWVLIANYSDKSLLRNTLGYKVSRIVGLTWTPRVRACDVYINNAYQGSYLVVQHKEVAGKKVDITPVTPEDNSEEAVQGDYYIEIESNDRDYRTAKLRIPIIFKDPKKSELTDTQRKYIMTYIADWEAAVANEDFDKVWEMMDMESFAKFWVIEELAKNIDGNFRKSTFMTKERGKKLILYHIWDFDIAFGNCNFMHSEFRPDSNGIYGNDPTGWFVKVVDEQKKGNGLYQHLFRNADFVACCKAIWQQVYPELCTLPDWLEAEAAVNRDSYDRNFQRWRILGTWVWPNPDPIPSDYDGELSFLKSFLIQRLAWMDSEIAKW